MTEQERARGFKASDLEERRRRRTRKLPKPRPKGALPYLPDDPELLAPFLTAAFRPPKGYEFENFDRSSARKTDPCAIVFRNGRERRTFRFDRQAELQGGSLRMVAVGATAGWLQMPHLSPGEIEDVWVALCTLGRVMTEFDQREETIKWLHQALDETVPMTGHTLATDGRHDALMALRAQGEFGRRDAEQLLRGGEGWQRRPVRFVDDQDHRQFLRAGELATFCWHYLGVRELSRATLRARLAEVSVPTARFEARQPPHPKMSLCELHPALVEYAESASPTAAPDAADGDAQATLTGVNDRGDRMAF